jgi:beta-glucosidase
MLDAHVYVYQSIKKNHPQATIGITHNIYQIDASNPYNPIHNLRRYFANKIAHTTMYEFFTRGTFNHRIPLVASVQHTNRHAPQSIDFVGLNYYGHGYIGTTGTTQRPTDEIPTQNPLYSIYAEGIYRAIKEISDNLTTPLQIPLYITENGVATDDDATRDLFLKRYLYAISKAIKDGYPVHGYIHWSLMDNYEWGSYDKKYGIYAVDRSVDAQTGKPKLNRTLRKGARYLIDLVHKHGQSA